MDRTVSRYLHAARDHLQAADKADFQASSRRWAAAEAMLAAADAGATRREIAEAVELSPAMIADYIAIARRYSGDLTQRPRWAEAWVEQRPRDAATPTRQRGVGILAREDPELVSEALKPDEAAAVAGAILNRRDVREHVRQDPERRLEIKAGAGRIVADEHDELDRRRARRGPTGGPLGGLQLFAVHTGLLAARSRIGEALETLHDLELDDEYRGILTRDLDRIEAVAGFFRAYLESGDRSMDDQLAELLAEEG